MCLQKTLKNTHKKAVMKRMRSKNKKKKDMTQKTNNKMAKGSPYLSIITLNVNALNFSIKRLILDQRTQIG